MHVDRYLPPGVGLGTASSAVAGAAAAGFDGVFTAETSHDPFLPIAVGAGSGPGLDFGTAIAVAFARSPMVTAMTAWDLQALTGGRFLLGLGTQVRGHVVRRFSSEWSAPGPRLREYIGAMRAIWSTFRDDVPLRFEGETYRFSLMTPFFNPGPIVHPDPKVFISAVGPYNCRLVGEVCDGIHIHPFHTVDYLRERVLPEIDAGAASAGRSADLIERAATVICVTGSDGESLHRSRESARQQISFYASTPAYRPVLEVEGWDVGEALTRLSTRGRWDEMAALVTDDMVDAIAVVAPIDRLGAAIRARYDGLLDRVGHYTLGGDLDHLDPDALAQLVTDTRG